MQAHFPNHKVKNFNGIDNLIVSLNRIKSFTVSLPGHVLDGSKISLKKSINNFSFSLSYKPLPGKQEQKELQFKQGQQITLINTRRKLFISNDSFLPVSTSYGVEKKYVTGHIDGFSSTNEDYNFNNKFHRLVIPTTKEISSTFFDLLPLSPFIYKTIVSRNMIECKINENIFETSLLVENDKYYIVFDSLQTLEFEEFNKYCFSVFLSFAFVNGKFIQDIGYFFTYSDKEMLSYDDYRFQVLIDSVITNDPIIPYRYATSCAIDFNSSKNNAVHASETYRNERLTSTVFNKLCDKIHNVEKVQRSIYNFIYANLDNAHKSLPSYYVILESLSSYIDTIHPALNSTPIKDSILSNDLFLQLKGTANHWYNSLTDKKSVDFNILLLRIDALNKPTNTDKLSSSLSSLAINIFPDQKNIIKARDRFLHGSVMKFSDYQELNKKTYHLKSRLQTLIAALILKLCDFNGCIINYSKLYEPYTLLTSGEIEHILI